MKKFLSRLPILLVCLFFSMAIMPSLSWAAVSDEEQSDLDVVVNPIYKSIISESEILNATGGGTSVSSDTLFTSDAEAGAYLRSQMVNRIDHVTLKYKYEKTKAPKADTVAAPIISEALKHTGVPNEGDYLRSNYKGYTPSLTSAKTDYGLELTITFSLEYYSTAAQEAQIDDAVADIIADIDAQMVSDTGYGYAVQSEYKRIRAIYEYITSTVAYDNGSNDIKYSTYGAVINHSAVCQGYASLFYRLALELGLDARFITGSMDGVNHAWNLVGCNGAYYYMDPTSDRGRAEDCWNFFIKGKSLTDRTITNKYDSTDTYIIADSDYTYCSLHSWEKVDIEKVAPTCTESGVSSWHCKKCGERKNFAVIEPLGHDFSDEWTVEDATCTEDGLKYHACSRCEARSDETVIYALGHEEELRNAAEATCTEAGYTGDTCCTRCDQVVEEGETIPALGHDTELRDAVDATCTEPGYTGDEYCTRCHQDVTSGTAIPALGHDTELRDAVDATCTESGYSGDKYCTRCEQVVEEGSVIAAKGHDLVKTEQKDADCTEDGVAAYFTCSTCEEVFSDENGENPIELDSWMNGEGKIPAAGHQGGTATCKDQAVCEVCGESYGEPDPMNHAGEIRTEGYVEETCTEDGYTGEKYCCDCDELLEEGTTIPMGHQWEVEATVDQEATCTEAGSMSIHCSRCDEIKDEVEIPATGHELKKVEAVEPTCTEDGVAEYYICNECDACFTDADGEEPISLEEWKDAEGRIAALGHTGGIATCIDKAQCDRCGEEYGELDLTHHVDGTEIKDQKDADCTEDGYTGDICCIHCGSIIAEGEVIPASHDWEDGYTVDQEATCTEAGSMSIHCSRCEETKDAVELPVTRHHVEKVDEVAPTCVEDGVAEHYACTECKTAFSDPDGENVLDVDAWKTGEGKIPATGQHVGGEATCTSPKICEICGEPYGKINSENHPFEALELIEEKMPTCTEDGWGFGTRCTACGQNIDDPDPAPAQHTWNKEYTVDKEPTCTETGIKSIHCSLCDATTGEAVIPVTEHNYGDWEEADRGEKRTCKDCGFVEERAIGHMHDFSGELIVDKEAACTEDGYGHHKCSECDKTSDIEIISAKGHSKSDTWEMNEGSHWKECSDCHEELDKENHNFGEWEIQEATCTEDGSKTRTCKDCSYEETEVIEKTGHKPDENWVIDKEYCTEYGQRHCQCENCNETITEKTKAAGHKVTEGEWENDQDYHWQYCSRCKENVKLQKHQYGEWEVTVEPGCETSGEKKRACSVCGYEETQAIEPLNHEIKVTGAKEATCTVDGNTGTKKCTRCGKTISEGQVIPKGHKMGDWKVVTAATCTKDGKSVRTCSRCDYKEEKTIPALGHEYSKTYTVDQAATLTKAGKESQHCIRCGKKINEKEIAKKALKAPAGLTVDLKKYNSIRATWNSVEGATGYVVSYKKSSASEWTTKKVSGTSYSSKLLSSGTTYNVKVKAVIRDSDGNVVNSGKDSGAKSITTLKKMTAPTIKKKGKDKVSVKSSKITSATGYQISKSISRSKTKIVATVASPSKDITAKKNKKYYYKVRAYRVVNGKKVFAPWSKTTAYILK